ncbi:MAG: prepilin-type N-terminal cleavage/methylation domain-containing protein [Planctomycetota bacterium]
MLKRNQTGRRGFSLMELLAVVTILGIIAAIIVPRVSVSTTNARTQVDAHNRATINAAVERYFIEEGSWPADISVIAGDADYFPDGIPANPVNASAPYALNATTHRVE